MKNDHDLRLPGTGLAGGAPLSLGLPLVVPLALALAVSFPGQPPIPLLLVLVFSAEATLLRAALPLLLRLLSLRMLKKRRRGKDGDTF